MNNTYIRKLIRNVQPIQKVWAPALWGLGGPDRTMINQISAFWILEKDDWETRILWAEEFIQLFTKAGVLVVMTVGPLVILEA